MHLVQIFLPLYDNAGDAIEHTSFAITREELVSRFDGMTAYNRTPVSGLWENDGKTVHDDVVIYEVMSEQLEREWWRQYRQTLEQRFRQQTLLIRAQVIELI